MMVALYGVLLAVGLVLLAVTAVRVLAGGLAGPEPTTAPRPGRGGAGLRVLDERYAAGELSTEEYQRRRRVLEGADR